MQNRLRAWDTGYSTCSSTADNPQLRQRADVVVTNLRNRFRRVCSSRCGSEECARRATCIVHAQKHHSQTRRDLHSLSGYFLFTPLAAAVLTGAFWRAAFFDALNGAAPLRTDFRTSNPTKLAPEPPIEGARGGSLTSGNFSRPAPLRRSSVASPRQRARQTRPEPSLHNVPRIGGTPRLNSTTPLTRQLVTAARSAAC